MKKSSLLIILFIVAFSATAYRPLVRTYFIRSGKVFFGSNENIKYSKEVIGADTLTFIINKQSRYYAQDKNHVYYNGEILDGADPRSFVFLGGLEHYRLRGRGYSKDDKNVFFENKRIDGADAGSFEVLCLYQGFGSLYENIYAKDQFYVFQSENRTGHDVASFEIFGWGYTADKRGIYCFGKKIENGKHSNFRHKLCYLINGNKVFYMGEEIPYYDADSFTLLNHVFEDEYEELKESIGFAFLTKDKNGIYFNNNKLNKLGLDINTVEMVKRNIIRDRNGIYKIIYAGADKKEVSFEKIDE